jgi:hypothetical protein
MPIKTNYLTAVLAAGAAAATIAAAPTAAAAAQQSPSPSAAQSCVSTATVTKCVAPGDAEINSSIPAPYGGPFETYGPFWAG